MVELDSSIAKNVWLLNKEAGVRSSGSAKGIFAVGNELRQVHWYHSLKFFVQDLFTAGNSRKTREANLENAARNTVEKVYQFLQGLETEKSLSSGKALWVEPKHPGTIWQSVRNGKGLFGVAAHSYRKPAYLKDVGNNCIKVLSNGTFSKDVKKIESLAEKLAQQHNIRLPDTVADF